MEQINSAVILKQEETGVKAHFLWGALIVLMMAQIGTSGDNAILGVATASLIKTLNASMNDIQLANMVYSLCAGCFMVVGGMLGIIIGWKRNFQIGATLCMLGELALSLSPSILMFTWGGRLFVGIGASLMIPSVLGLIAGIYKGKDRALAFGAIGAATGIASAMGPIVAGLLIDTAGWRVAFGCLAIYFAIVLAGSLLVPKVEKATSKLKMDYVGTIIAAIGLFLLLIGISKISTWGLISPINAPITIFGISPALPMAILGLVILIILVPVERKIEEKNGCALIPRSFLSTPQVRNGLYGSAMLFLCLGGAVMVVNPYLQIVGGFNALKTGVAMIAMGLPMFLFSMGMPKYFPKASPKKVMRLGILLAGIAVIPMAMSLKNDGVSVLMYIGLFIFGTGQGLVSSQNSNIVADAVNSRDAQQSGGIQATSRNVGQAIGVAILGMVMLFSMSSAMHSQVNDQSSLSAATKSHLTQQSSFSFVSDSNFKQMMNPIVKNKTELNQLTDMNANARKNSTKMALYVMGILTLLFLFGTKNVPDKLS
ncbi:MFS transporter [Bacillus sp. 1P06AnD]|uniref:MFS transporter n=1 Tax=Bacillus sp. 1P06AnD TaxID=3132208 RepID=UPI0039A15FDF